MKRVIVASILSFVLLFAFGLVAYGEMAKEGGGNKDKEVYASAQMAERGAKNTMKLPNGEVIWDLNGEWDVINENYGLWSQYGIYPNIHKITQTGSSIVGVLTMDDRWYQAGYQYIGAELDKTGFMKVKIYTNLGTLDSKGWVSEDGNKIVIDDGKKFKMTLTRK